MKSFLAVVAGLMFTIAASITLDLIMYSSGLFPAKGESMATNHWLIALGYRMVCAIGGGWITARFAPARPIFHSVILGGIGTLIALVGCVLSWNAGPAFGPHWYPIALIVTALPVTWLGGKLGARQDD
jgi:hypothetical protein